MVFISVGIFFLIFGIAFASVSSKLPEVTQRYDNLSGCAVNLSNVSTCTVSITIPHKMIAPVYMYYKLTSFYQNHRLYIKSRSDTQLDGTSVYSLYDSSNCDPYGKGSDSKTIYPCGMISGSVFTDRYTATVTSAGTTTTLPLSSSGIAWKEDQKKFVVPSTVDYTTVNTTAISYPNTIGMSMFNTSYGVRDEDLMVWMRTAALPTFNKLHRIINQDLLAGDVVTFTVSSTFDVTSMGSTKSIVLANMSWLGGRHDLLAGSYLFVGIVMIFFGVGCYLMEAYYPIEKRSNRVNVTV